MAGVLVERPVRLQRFQLSLEEQLPAFRVETGEHPGPFLPSVVAERRGSSPQRQHAAGVPLQPGPLRVGLAPTFGIFNPRPQQELVVGCQQFVDVADQLEKLLR